MLCFSSSCVPYVASFSRLSFLYCPFGIFNVYWTSKLIIRQSLQNIRLFGYFYCYCKSKLYSLIRHTFSIKLLSNITENRCNIENPTCDRKFKTYSLTRHKCSIQNCCIISLTLWLEMTIEKHTLKHNQGKLMAFSD